MNEYILLMHDDVTDRASATDPRKWESYLTWLRHSGRFEGGSSIGSGESVKHGRPALPARPGIAGFMRVRAENLVAAKQFLLGNPVYDAGGTVDVRELVRDSSPAPS